MAGSRLSRRTLVAIAAQALTRAVNGNRVAPARPRARTRGTVLFPELISVRGRPVLDRAQGVAVVVARDCPMRARLGSRAKGSGVAAEGPTRAMRAAADGARGIQIHDDHRDPPRRP